MMTRADHWRRFSQRRGALAMSLSLFTLFVGGIDAQAPRAAANLTPNQVIVSIKDVVLYPPDHGLSAFRFLPDGSPNPFTRTLVLSAAPGETRRYLLQTGPNDSVAKGDAPIVAYVVDKSRPSAPRAEPGTGLYYGAVSPELKSAAGSEIFWALVGPDGSAGAFVRYGPDSRPRIAPPAAGSVTYALLAYAVKGSGTRSYPSRFVYRMAEPGMPAASPRPDTAPLAADPSLAKPAIAVMSGYVELRMTLPPGGSLLADFSAEAPPSSVDDFEVIEAGGGMAKLRVPCPYGWSGDVGLYYGMLKDGVASYNPQPLVLHLSFPADEQSLPADPPAPVLAADPAGRGGFLAFPAYDGDIYVSVGNAKPVVYASPIALPGEATSARVAWYGEDSSGQRSATRSQTFSMPVAVPDVELTGAAQGASIGGDVLLKPAINAIAVTSSSSEASIRYEFRVDGSFPPEPGSSSPALGEGLAIACPPGEERSVVLRYRLVSGGVASEGRILRFTLDRKPPEAPRFRELPSDAIDRPRSIEILPGSGGKDVFASVSAGGAPAPFVLVTSPIALAGSEAGPVGYLIRAYDVDAAGNRSQEMKAVSLVVDSSSVYVAEDGPDKGDGSQERPYRNLDAAIAVAMRGGKRNINLRGSLEMRASAQFSSEMNLVGGFGKSWVKDGQGRATVRVTIPQGQSAFSQRGGSLSLSRVELRAESAGPGPLIELSGASLSIADSTIGAGSDGDLVLVSAAKSKISLANSRIQALRAMSFTAFSSESSDISLTGSSITAAQGVRIFGAFDMDGGALALRQSLVESRSDLGLNLISLRSASLLVDRSLITAEGGSGFLRLGSFKAVTGEMKNSKIILSWKGPGTLFEISEGGPSFRHDTIQADSAKGPLRFFDLKGGSPQVWNCILDSSGVGAELLRSDSIPGAGALVADCVWGFDKLLSGALETSDLRSLNALNAGSVLYSSKPIVSESPESSFAAPLKSQAPLRKSSICVGAALALESGYEVDFGGHPRPAPGKDAPDIGADELSD
jgi:hypothetical protein